MSLAFLLMGLLAAGLNSQTSVPPTAENKAPAHTPCVGVTPSTGPHWSTEDHCDARALRCRPSSFFANATTFDVKLSSVALSWGHESRVRGVRGSFRPTRELSECRSSSFVVSIVTPPHRSISFFEYFFGSARLSAPAARLGKNCSLGDLWCAIRSRRLLDVELDGRHCCCRHASRRSVRTFPSGSANYFSEIQNWVALAFVWPLPLECAPAHASP